MHCRIALTSAQFLTLLSMRQSSVLIPSKVDCESISVRDQFSSGERQEEHYERWVDNK